MAKKPLVAWSLFSGCGGLDLGFERVGVKIEAAHDIDPTAVENYNNNLASSCFVTDVSSDTFKIPSGLDIVLSGSPCQGFSLAGKRDINDPRNSLLIHASKLIAKAKPRAVLFENVPGALAGDMRTIWDESVKILTKAGYNINFEVLSLNEYGIPQLRKRVFLVGMLNKAVHPLAPALQREPATTLGSVLKNVEHLGSSDLFSEFKRDSADWAIAQRIAPGMKLCDVRAGDRSVHSWQIPEVFGTTTSKEREVLATVMRLRRQVRRRDTGDADPVNISLLCDTFGSSTNHLIESLVEKSFLVFAGNFVDLKRRFNGKYRRSDSESHSYTVDTSFGNPRYFLHPSENRGFSAREAARIQTFPDDYCFTGSAKDQFKMIGNAVPPAIATKIAAIFRSSLR